MFTYLPLVVILCKYISVTVQSILKGKSPLKCAVSRILDNKYDGYLDFKALLDEPQLSLVYVKSPWSS